MVRGLGGALPPRVPRQASSGGAGVGSGGAAPTSQPPAAGMPRVQSNGCLLALPPEAADVARMVSSIHLVAAVDTPSGDPTVQQPHLPAASDASNVRDSGRSEVQQQMRQRQQHTAAQQQAAAGLQVHCGEVQQPPAAAPAAPSVAARPGPIQQRPAEQQQQLQVPPPEEQDTALAEQPARAPPQAAEKPAAAAPAEQPAAAAPAEQPAAAAPAEQPAVPPPQAAEQAAVPAPQAAEQASVPPALHLQLVQPELPSAEHSVLLPAHQSPGQEQQQLQQTIEREPLQQPALEQQPQQTQQGSAPSALPLDGTAARAGGAQAHKRPASRQRAELAALAAAGGGRGRRSHLAPLAAEAAPGADAAAAKAAQPAAKRRKKAEEAPLGGGGRGRHKYTDVLHRTIAVPGRIFFVDTPGKFFYGKVTKAEQGRKVPAVELRFTDDGSVYWFPLADVRQWCAEMVATGTWARHNPGVPPPEDGEDEQQVAAALQSLPTSHQASGAGAGDAERGVVDSGRRGGPRGKRGTEPAAAKQAPPARLQRSGSGGRRASALMAAVEAKSEGKAPAQ